MYHDLIQASAPTHFFREEGSLGTKHTRFKIFTVQHYVFEVRPLNEQRSLELNATPVTESASTASEVPPETSRNVSNPDDIGANIDCMNSR